MSELHVKAIEEIGFSPTERLVMLIIAGNCNCRCKYCYELFKKTAYMEMTTARHLVRTEMEAARLHGVKQLTFDFMGGEPLLNFPLIRGLSEWIWANSWPVEYQLICRTNGLLLNDEMRRWMQQNKHRITFGLSMDGLPEMHRLNRSEELPDLDFFMANWAEQPIKITLFRDSVHLLADTVIHWHKLGIPFTITPGEGFEWGADAEKDFEEQMDRLVAYYVKNSELKPVEPLFSDHFRRCFPEGEAAQERPMLCGNNTGIVAYDCDGTPYRCHMFTPLVQGAKAAELDKQLAHTIYAEIDSACSECPARNVCRNCFGLNCRDFHSINISATRKYACRIQKKSFCASAELYLKRQSARLDSGAVLSDEEKETISLAIRVYDYFS